MGEFEVLQLRDNMSEEPYVLFVGHSFDFRKEAAKRLMELPWSCVVTSIRDDDFSAGFIREDRLSRDLFDKSQLQQRIFGKRNLSIVRLFSTNSQDMVEGEYVPGRAAQANAFDMLYTIVGLMKFSGKILVTGYEKNDLLAYERFLDVCDSCRKGSLFVFGVEESEKDSDFCKIIDEKDVYVNALRLEDILPNNDTYEYEEIYGDEDYHQERIYIEGKLKWIEKKDLFNIKRVALPLSIEVVKEVNVPPFLVENYFYKFLKESPFQPQWYGYGEGFNLYREYEKRLYDKTIHALNYPGEDNLPICLNGQSGSGKSIALANLAYRIFCEKKYPVVFIQNKDNAFVFTDNISRSSTINGFETFSAYLDMLKKMGARTALIILDVSASSMPEREKCIRLYEMLHKNRGHNLQVVFSSYEVKEIDEKRKLQNRCVLIDAITDIEQGSEESKKLKTILKRKAKLTKEEIENISDMIYKKTGYDRKFMGLLYRIFFEVRPSLEQGIKREATKTIDAVIAQINDEVRDDKYCDSTIAEAFFQVFNNSDIKDGFFQVSSNNGAKILKEDIRKLLSSVAVCTVHNQPMPSDMAYRLLPTTDYRVIREISKIPFFIFREKEESGEFEFWIRTKIEAVMLLRSYAVNEEGIVNIIVDMIRELKCVNSYSHDVEVDLMAKILHNIGPNSDDRKNRIKYREYYPRIIEALGDLRKESGGNPRLTLQEIVYIREYSVQKSIDSDFAKKDEYLRRAIRIGEDELMNMAHHEKGSLKDMLTIEINNSRLQLSQREEPQDLPMCQQIQRECRTVIQHNPESSYAYSTMMRAALIEYNLLDNEEDKAKLLSQYSEIIERIRGEHPELAEQNDLMEVSEALYKKIASIEMSEKYFQNLIEKQSDAGIHLRARQELNSVGISLYQRQVDGLSKHQLNVCDEVCKRYLENPDYEGIVSHSEQCQQMLLRLKWLMYNHEPVFCGEKSYTYMSQDNWQSLLGVCENYVTNIYNEAGDYYSANTMLYVMALSYAQLGDFENAAHRIAVIRKKTDELFFENRIRINHILCDEHGKPLEFSGRFVSQTTEDENKGFIQLDKIPAAVNIGHRSGVFYHQANMKHTIRRAGQRYNDFQLGIGFMGLSVFRGLKNNKKR